MIKKYFILLISILFLVSCHKQFDFNSIKSELPEFDIIELYSFFQVYLISDTSNFIEINGDSKIIQSVEYSINKSILKIDNNSNSKWLKPNKNKVELYIHYTKLSEINANETCNIRTLNAISSESIGIIFRSKANEANLELNCGTIYYWNDFPCGGKLTLWGNSNHINIWNYALVTVDAKNLNTYSALIENSSKGNCLVKTTHELTYSINGTGNIILYGNPTKIIKKDCSSTGKLIQK